MIDYNSEIARWKREGAREAVGEVLFKVNELMHASEKSNDSGYRWALATVKSKILAVARGLEEKEPKE